MVVDKLLQVFFASLLLCKIEISTTHCNKSKYIVVNEIWHGQKKPVTSAKLKFLVSRRASTELIKAVKGESEFQPPITSRQLNRKEVMA